MGHVHYLCACLSTVVVTLPVWADTAKKIDFAHDIVPLIKKHCGECHTNGKRKGSLSLDTRESILKAKIAVPGKSSDSSTIPSPRPTSSGPAPASGPGPWFKTGPAIRQSSCR